MVPRDLNSRTKSGIVVLRHSVLRHDSRGRVISRETTTGNTTTICDAHGRVVVVVVVVVMAQALMRADVAVIASRKNSPNKTKR